MFNKIADGLYYLLTIPVVPIGKSVVTVWMIIYVGALLATLILLARIIRDRVTYPALAKTNLDISTQHSVGMVSHYVTVGVGVLIILNTAGIETTALTVVAGAVGLGLSLGLQTIAKNFVGGMILLFERPIKLGDRIQIAGVAGDVTKIALRSTTLKTIDHTEVVIPNGDFMNEKITNWTGRMAVVSVSISASAEIDPEAVRSLLLEVGSSNPKVVSDPAPQAWLESLGEKTLNYTLRVTTADLVASQGQLKSELNLEIYRRMQGLTPPRPVQLKETVGVNSDNL